MSSLHAGMNLNPHVHAPAVSTSRGKGGSKHGFSGSSPVGTLVSHPSAKVHARRSPEQLSDGRCLGWRRGHEGTFISLLVPVTPNTSRPPHIDKER